MDGVPVTNNNITLIDMFQESYKSHVFATCLKRLVELSTEGKSVSSLHNASIGAESTFHEYCFSTAFLLLYFRGGIRSTNPGTSIPKGMKAQIF